MARKNVFRKPDLQLVLPRLVSCQRNTTSRGSFDFKEKV